MIASMAIVASMNQDVKPVESVKPIIEEYVATDKAEYTLGDTIIVDGWVDTSPIVYGVGGQSVDMKSVIVSLNRWAPAPGFTSPLYPDKVQSKHCNFESFDPAQCDFIDDGRIYVEFEVLEDYLRGERYRIDIDVWHQPYPSEYEFEGGLPDTYSVIKSPYFALK